jgi:hypothetical protein
VVFYNIHSVALGFDDKFWILWHFLNQCYNLEHDNDNSCDNSNDNSCYLRNIRRPDNKMLNLKCTAKS